MEIQRTKNEKIKKYMFAPTTGSASAGPREELENWLENNEEIVASANQTTTSSTPASTGQNQSANLSMQENGRVWDSGNSTKTPQERSYRYDESTGNLVSVDGKHSISREEAVKSGLSESDWAKISGSSTSTTEKGATATTAGTGSPASTAGTGTTATPTGAKQESDLETLNRAEEQIDQLHNEGKVSDEDYAKAKSDFAQKKLEATEKQIEQQHNEGKMSEEAYARAKSDIERAKKAGESNQTGEGSTSKEESNGIERVKKGKDGKSVSQDEVTAAATGDSTINRGDTLWKYATETGHSVATLALINGIANPDLIYAGDTIDFDINKENVESAATSIQALLDSLQAVKDNFNIGEVKYNSGGFHADVNGKDTRSTMDEIKLEIEHNEETTAKDAVNYKEWLNKIIESLNADEQHIGGIMGNTDLLSINQIDG